MTEYPGQNPAPWPNQGPWQAPAQPQGGFPPPGGGPGGGFTPGGAGGYSQGGFGPGGPGGFGPGGPGGFAPYGPPRRRNATPWIVSGVAVVAVGALALVLVMTLGGSKSSNDAKGVVDKLLQAAQHKDLKTAQSLTCDPLNKELVSSPLAGVTKYQLGDAQEDGDSATVPITATVLGEETNYTAAAQKQGGSWKVCNVEEGGPGAQSGQGAGNAKRPTAALGPKETVQKLLQAAKDKDMQTVLGLTCDSVHSQIEKIKFPNVTSFTVGAAKVDGTSATVGFTEVIDGQSANSVAQLQLQNTTWKVCDF